MGSISWMAHTCGCRRLGSIQLFQFIQASCKHFPQSKCYTTSLKYSFNSPIISFWDLLAVITFSRQPISIVVGLTFVLQKVLFMGVNKNFIFCCQLWIHGSFLHFTSVLVRDIIKIDYYVHWLTPVLPSIHSFVFVLKSGCFDTNWRHLDESIKPIQYNPSHVDISHLKTKNGVLQTPSSFIKTVSHIYLFDKNRCSPDTLHKNISYK